MIGRPARAVSASPLTQAESCGSGIDTERFAADVLAGLRGAPKTLPCKYFYDRRGSELFEQICELDEYYLTRTELGIMERHAAEMAALLGARCLLVELGSGSSRKTRLLLDRLDRPAGYVPIDISIAALEESAALLERTYPRLEVLPLCADFTEAFDIPAPSRSVRRRVVYFPGSTIGNFAPAQAEALLGRIAQVIGPGGGLLLGADLRKDPGRIQSAYDDAAGVTAAFNLNLLGRINRELGADFALDRFRHRAVYDEARGRVEMHLVSPAAQTVRVRDQVIRIAAGETILTELSHKYEPAGIRRMAAAAGLTTRRVWTDPDALFSVLYLTRSPEPVPSDPDP